MDALLSGLIVFGILMAISLFGLFRSNAASDRLNATTERSDERRTFRSDGSTTPYNS